ncbi:MAG TPA: gluconate 2-dehydrogenase subunit 3 family protein [Steroidobacter sp.]|uniref:gluconate 2-dehydrogenase subunit 3 family protein n=1 Tax=Steroidobacter sp. TaxID=1978227 RepID=UPI002ED9C876
MTFEPVRVDRRTTLKWVLAAAATSLLARERAAAAPGPGPASSAGYGTDPDLQRIYAPGELWSLTLTAEQRVTAAALCDLIIPADERSVSASSAGVVDFIDEWISAPYREQRADREMVIAGLRWMDEEAVKRFSRPFAALDVTQSIAIADDICYLPKAQPRCVEASRFFARYRDLTAGGFYASTIGCKDLQYVGNIPLARFDGPPLEVLRAVGLS